jgi:hypothetical protein
MSNTKSKIEGQAMTPEQVHPKQAKLRLIKRLRVEVHQEEI